MNDNHPVAIDLAESVYALCTAHPDLAAVLASLGFADILRPGMLQTAGRFMTLPKGAALKGITSEALRAGLAAHGYTIVP